MNIYREYVLNICVEYITDIKHDVLYINMPLVFGPMQLATNGNIVPICKSTGALHSFAMRWWYLNTSLGKNFSHSYLILKASS